MSLFDFIVWALSGGFWRFAGALVFVAIVLQGLATIIAACASIFARQAKDGPI